MENKSKRSVVGKVIAAVLVILAIGAVILGVSAYDLLNDAKKAQESYTKFEECVNNEDYQGALTSIHELSARLDTMGDKVNGPQWQVASIVPFVGEDVRCVRGLASIGDALANDALMPVLKRVENAYARIESSNIDLLEPNGLDNAVGLVESLGNDIDQLTKDVAHAREVVKKCEADTNTLPTSHFDELNKLKVDIHDATKRASDIFDLADALPNLLGSITGATAS